MIDLRKFVEIYLSSRYNEKKKENLPPFPLYNRMGYYGNG